MKSELTRGGRKLESALAAFGLSIRARAANAIDVGASTGGFVSVLLARGASHVTAIDVGHGQLVPEIARDGRVTNLERMDFKTMPLSVAPGPFDFFTVDVSFVAGRSMLRGLAFRLNPGAEGVVLIKPQFELPRHLVRGGNVEAPELRKRALDVYTAKAQRLGFEVLSTCDSPVAGGSGTIEILAHLRFRGRPDSLPRPGERKPGRVSEKRARPRIGSLSWFAVASPGLERPLREELAAMPGITLAREVAGGVEFAGPLASGMAANLGSRIATRIVARAGEVKAREFAQLRRGLARLPWPSFIPTGRALRVDVSTSHCRLYHTGALADTLSLAIEDCVGKLPARDQSGDASPDDSSTRVLLRGQDDRFVASVDSSGALLHRRGWRLEAGRAPLRETLAAGILDLCAYDPTLPLVDPMCGSGTIVIEAAAKALGLAPGSGRAFAFERWPMFDQAAWENLRGPEAGRAYSPGTIIASDRDASAVAMACRNAARARVEDHIRFAVAKFGDGEIPSPPGLLILNPPYGHRLGQRGRSLSLARSIGQTLAMRYQGWRAAVLCPDAAFVAAVAAGMRRKPGKTTTLRNGGLQITLALWM
ncbi:MAG: SAM-dependent methyltransferase [Polyangia bacterium]